MKVPLLADAGNAGIACPRRADPRLRKLAYPGPYNYGTEFPKLFYIPARSKIIAFCFLVVFVILCVTVWKHRLEQIGLTTFIILKFLSLPVVSVLFTYGHIWLALYMTFYPTEFFGIPGCQVPESPFGLGWQGIVPSKSRKMSKRFINLITSTLFSLQEVLQKIDTEVLLSELHEPLLHDLNHVVQEIGSSEAPEAWNLMPKAVKEELVLKIVEDLPETMNSLMHRITEDIDHVFDIEEFVVESVAHDKALFNHVFIKLGYPEIGFIRDCGGYMGLFFGIVQMLQQFFYPAGFLLPVFGVLVGLFTNWLALQMTFSPVNPVPILGGRVVLQGCFLTRQDEFAPGYAKFTVDNLMNTRRLIPGIVAGRCSDALCAVLHEELSAGVDRSARTIQPIIHIAGYTAAYKHIQKIAIQKICDRLPDLFLKASSYVDEAMGIEAIMADRVRALPSAEFENLLHPIFQEDEWLLILVGGILGYIVGSLQWKVLGS